MTNVELTGFILTIASFIISTLLGILAIWLTKYFDSKTSETLKEVKELTTEIKSLTNTSIGHQEKITSKILDNILNQSSYGPQFQNTMDETNESKTELEQLITTLFQEQEKKMEQFKEQISKINHIENKSEDEIDILTTLINWTSFPAHFVLLYAIFKEKPLSTVELGYSREKYGLPTYFERGVNNIIEKKILLGTGNNFKINPEYEIFISNWLDENEFIIEQISQIFRESSLTEENRNLSKKADNRVKKLTSQLNFNLEKQKASIPQ